jgi:serine/threonine protein kinase
VVYKALWASKNTTVACKCIDIALVANSNIKSKIYAFAAELAAYIKCQGLYIVPTYGCSVELLSSTNLRLIILMEYMPRGSLTNLLQKEYGQLTFRKKMIIACNIAAGMNHIHQHGMIHRDLRPDNILIDNHYRAKIGDMGISQSYKHVYGDGNANALIGCMRYMPQEFYQHIFTDKLDIFTFGLTLNHLFTGVDHSFNPFNRKISLTQSSPIFPNLINSCVNDNYHCRPTAQTIESHLRSYRTHLEQKLQFNPQYQYLSKEQKDSFCLSIYRERYFDTNACTGF